MKPDVVWRIRAAIVVERPTATLTMNEMTVVVLLVWTQSRDPACLAIISPKRGIDPVVGIERGDDDIGDAGVAFGVDEVRVQAQCESAETATEGMERLLMMIVISGTSSNGKTPLSG